MPNRKLLLLGLAAALAAPAAAQAMLADVPLEIIAARSELIVVADVVETGQPLRLEMKVPDSPQPIRTWFRKYKLRVTRVISENGRVAAGPAAKPADREVQIFTRCPQPRQPGRPMIAVSDMYFASLKGGASYVVILRKLAGKPEYYLPSYPKNLRLARKEDIVRIEQAADVAKWPWGKAVNGLQIALVPARTTVQLRQVRRSVRGPDGRLRQQFGGLSAYIPCVVALRNIAKAPLTVSLYDPDKFLSVTATGPKGKVVKADLYRGLAGRRTAPFGPQHTATIAPSKLVFVGPAGKANYGLGVNLDASEGKWRLQAAYASGRKADAPAAPGDVGAQPLWTGTVKSAPATVEVRKPSEQR